MRGTERPHPSRDSALLVGLPDGRVLDFSDAFYIGREAGCEIRIDHIHVSRRHAQVLRQGGEWIIRDLQSSNGLFVDGKRTDAAPIGRGVTITLGANGPVLQIDPAPPAAAPPEPVAAPMADEQGLLDAYAERYFGPDTDEPAGERTMMIRRAFQNIQERQRRRQRIIVAAITLVALGTAAYAVYQYAFIRRQGALAERIFYNMKAFDVEFAQLEQRLAGSGNAPGQQEVARYMARRRELERDYEAYVTGLYDRSLNEKDRLILRITRLFGECDVAAPPGYVQEVAHYIREWQRTGRFERAVKVARDLGYTQKIVEAFTARGLPAQYFYLGMVESDFNRFAVGSKTRWGYAKGMWQFIPDTGRTYGLRIGPLAAVAQPDPEDDRFDWQKATEAAASYVKNIYATDAQASGLLVMASYNWGERRVIDLLKTMPDNPRERNFWMLLAKHRDRVPLESYNYVYRIVSAAVIGENPRLFGIEVDNPLKALEPGAAQGTRDE